jgi:hypothetical protein
VTESEQQFFALFKALGLCVEVIPEGQSKSCDFRLRFGTENYLVEVKTRTDNADSTRAIRHEGKGTFATRATRTNRTSTILREAVSQLASSATEADTFRLVCLAFDSWLHNRVLVQQLFSTLYGVQKLMLTDNSEALTSNECIYFTHSVFHKHTDLDAVCFTAGTQVSLCVNEFAERCSQFRTSHLYQELRNRGAVVEPRELVETNGWFVADTSIDRSDADAITAYVKAKYGLTYLELLDFTQHTAVRRTDTH